MDQNPRRQTQRVQAREAWAVTCTVGEKQERRSSSLKCHCDPGNVAREENRWTKGPFRETRSTEMSLKGLKKDTHIPMSQHWMFGHPSTWEAQMEESEFQNDLGHKEETHISKMIQ